MRTLSGIALLACTSLACTVGGDDEAATFGTAMTTMPSTSMTGGSSEDESAGEASTASADGSTGDSEQPEDGMYSDCMDAAACVGLNACVTFPADAAPTDGYCTRTGCESAIADCAPAPGGTAGPACVEVTINDVMQIVCALDCSGGETCPAGMTCYAYGTLDLCS